MSEKEAEEFARRPFAADAVSLRRWDETAKELGLQTPTIEHFLQHLLASPGAVTEKGVRNLFWT